MPVAAIVFADNVSVPLMLPMYLLLAMLHLSLLLLSIKLFAPDVIKSAATVILPVISIVLFALFTSKVRVRSAARPELLAKKD
jgi:hypothetical protein